MAKAAAKKPAAKAPSKSEVFANISTATGLSKKDVAAVFDAMTEEVKKAMSKKGAGVFQLPGLAKIVRVHKPAQPAKPNSINPFTKEVYTKPAQPAKSVVKVRALKSLKGMV
jgi:nucleoid DNA-binding protein